MAYNCEMDEQQNDQANTTKKLGFLAGAGVAAAVLYELAPALAAERKTIEKWFDRIDRKTSKNQGPTR